MKLVTLLLLIFTFAVKGQMITQYGDWAVEDQGAVFKKVYESKKDSAALAADLLIFLKSLGYLKDMEVSEGIIYGNLSNYIVDYEKYGKKTMSTPFIFISGIWRGRVAIKVKSNSYRIKITDVNSTTSLYTLELQQANVNTSWDELILRKDRLSFKQSGLKNLDLLGMSLSDYFKLKSDTSDW